MTPNKESLDRLRIDRASAPRGKPFLVIILFLLVITIGGAAGWWWYQHQTVAIVKTTSVRETTTGGAKTLLNASGYVTARRESTVSSKITGKVIEVLVEEGMEVKAGQELARLDSSNVERSLHLAEAQLVSAKENLNETQANLEQAERDLKRTSAMADEKVVTQAELETSQTLQRALKARLQRQQSEVTVAEHEVEVWKQQLDDTIIRAPFAGIVTSKDAQPGEMISPMSAGGAFTRTGICTIVDMTSLEIEVDVNESYINRVVPGQTVQATLDSYPDWLIPAKVIAIIPTADRQKATVKVRVGFESLDPRVLPDMSVKVAFQSTGEEKESRLTLSIPKTAVHQDGGRDIVWVVRDERTERRAVTIESSNEIEVSVAAGLNSGDRVVVEGAVNLTDGAKVTEVKE